MQLIIGFGNPGNQYNFTRHNFGFLSLDFYAKTRDLEFKPEPKFLAHTARSGDIIFAKPQTFYNEIGQSIARLSHFYKMNPSTDLLVLCDDLNIPFGATRYRNQGSDGGNNGLKSTIQHLGTTDFSRLRLGTDNPDLRKNLDDADFVLSKFTPEEYAQLPQILPTITSQIDDFLAPTS